jgi:hypothetical protein
MKAKGGDLTFTSVLHTHASMAQAHIQTTTEEVRSHSKLSHWDHVILPYTTKQVAMT